MLIQLIRFGLVGGLATALQGAVYSPLAGYRITTPQIANIFGYVAAMVAGYILHSKWSFQGHGRRDNPKRTTIRFVIVSLVSYLMNAFFIFVLTDARMLGGPWYWPLGAFLFVTPAVTFTLNRKWVFR
jgi:putative flippase GtrA